MSLICTGKNVDILATGEYQAVCSQVVDLGQQKNVFTKGNGEKEEKIIHQCLFIWELKKEYDSGDGVFRRHQVSKKYTFTISKNSSLYKDLQGWTGNLLTDQHLEKGIDLENMIGRNCTLNIEVKQGSNGRDYTNVTTVTPYTGTAPIIPQAAKGELPVWVCKMIDAGQNNLTTPALMQDPWADTDPFANNTNSFPPPPEVTIPPVAQKLFYPTQSNNQELPEKCPF